MAYAGGTFDIIFDFTDHRLIIETSDGRAESFALKPMTVAYFYAELMLRLRHLGIEVHIWTMPSEIENAIPFDQDHTHAQYDPDLYGKFTRALTQADRVMKEFRARFIGRQARCALLLGQPSIWQRRGFPAARRRRRTVLRRMSRAG
jgi:hypothetical protein